MTEIHNFPPNMRETDKACFRLSTLGRNVLALAGTTVALLPAFLAAAPGVNASEHRQSLKIGIATYGEGVAGEDPNLISDMAKWGANSLRISDTRDNNPQIDSACQDATGDLARGAAEVQAAQKKKISVSVVLQQSPLTSREGFADWAASSARCLSTDGLSTNEFIVENEVNSKVFYRGSIREYVDELAQTHSTIKAIEPGAVVVGFALAPHNHPIAYIKKAARYAQKKYGGLDEIMDALSIHLYSSVRQDEQLVKRYEELWRGPILVNEAGFPSRAPNDMTGHDYARKTVSLRHQAAEEAQLIEDLSKDSQIKVFDNYREWNSGQPKDLATGLNNFQGAPLPLQKTMKRITKIIKKHT